MNSSPSPNAISLPASDCGHTPCGSPAGPTLALVGPDPALANLSASQAKAAGLLMSGIFGPLSFTSLRSVNLQSSLASRLQARMAGLGSPLFDLTWKQRDMPSGPPICALRASGRRTSGKGCIGWPTPTVPNGGRSVSTETMDATGRTADGRKHCASLEHAVKFAGWPTPTVSSGAQHKDSPTPGQTGGTTLECAARCAAWPTARSSDGDKGVRTMRGASREPERRNGEGLDLPTTATLASGWATPTTRDWKDGATSLENTPVNALLGRQVLGAMSNGSNAPTAKPGQLNPAFSRWLMGCPAAWGYCPPGAVDWLLWQGWMTPACDAPGSTGSRHSEATGTR